MTTAASVTFHDWRFIPLHDEELAVRFRTNLNSPVQAPWTIDERVTIPETQGPYQQVYRQRGRARVVDLEVTFSEIDGRDARGWRDLVLQHIEAGTEGYLKSPHGDVWKGVLLAPSGQSRVGPEWETVRFKFRETGRVP